MKTKTEIKNGSWMQFTNSLVVQSGVVLLCLTASLASAQTYSILHTFGTNVMGRNPHATLVQGSDGALYGTTENGGRANRGQVFRVNPDGSGYTVLKDFTGSDGANPVAGLVLSGSTLYGTTANGGTNDDGTVFKLSTDGNGFVVLKEFNWDDGISPLAGLALSGTTLYGTTFFGGSFGHGTVFKVNTDGSGFTVVMHGADNDGANPYGSLVLSGTTLYGITGMAGNYFYGHGTLFKVNVDGSGYAVLKDFTNFLDGVSPNGDLVLSDTTLYGTTYSGDNYGFGTVFKISTDGSSYTILKEFTNSIEGVNPSAGLLLSGTTLYGTTVNGGRSDNGTLFKVNTDGTGFIVLKDFTNSADGYYSYASLMLSGSTLYGTTCYGGNNGYGAVFKVETNGSSFSVITHFVGRDGVSPSGNLLQSGTTLYGATTRGGASGNGTLFKVNADGSGYTVLKDFNNQPDGSKPNGGLVLSGATLYGTTAYGGMNDSGTLFQINTDGSGYTLLYHFSAVTFTGSYPIETYTNADGAWPKAGLTLSGTTLYGTTWQGGATGYGTIFKVNTDGSGFTVLRQLNASAGANPLGSLVLSGATLYGTTSQHGGKGGGTVFRMNTDGSGFTVVKDFDTSDGLCPEAGLALLGTTLYGTTVTGGGSDGAGTVFAVNTDGSGFRVLQCFTDAGARRPSGSVVLSGATLYGATPFYGGEGCGTLFQVNTDGSDFAVLKYFTGDDGAYPQAGLVLSGSTLYGMTASGGGLGSGVLFGLSLAPAPIITPPQTQTAEVGSAVGLRVKASGSAPLFCLWYLNCTNLVICSTNWELDLTRAQFSQLELTNVQFAQSGTYTVVVTNLFGAVTSTPAMLNVISRVDRRPVPGVKVTGETGSWLNVDYANSLSPAPNWTTLGSVSLASTSQFYFDLTAPLPPQRFYRAWQTGTPSVVPSLNLNIVPAITLTGKVGDFLRLDYINAIGPTNDWVTLDTVTLTNTSQLYFDVSSIGQPRRLYRIVPAP
jgi:uncharacterized repeat protein (TIGR03803 family)